MLLAMALTSCSPRIITRTAVRDSIVTQINTRVVTDTVSIEIPVEIEKNVTRDTVSHLANTYAESDAVVSGGLLTHTLKSRPQTIYVPVEVHVTDTVMYESHSQTEPVTVPAPLRWGQKFRLKGFWWLMAIAVIGWRREIIWLVKRIIKLFGV